MIDAQETNLNEAQYWLELANGGGVMWRDPNVRIPPKPQHLRPRRQKQLDAPRTTDV